MEKDSHSTFRPNQILEDLETKFTGAIKNQISIFTEEK